MSTRTNNSGCLTAITASFSRWFLIFFWIARPVQWQGAFDTIIFPCLGFLFLPFTTLMYYLLQTSSAGRIGGIDYLWLLLAVLIDIASVGAAGAANRNRIPSGMPGSTATPSGTA